MWFHWLFVYNLHLKWCKMSYSIVVILIWLLKLL
jgi:hypothetical protein